MIRFARVEDAQSLQVICKEDLGYDQPLESVTKQLARFHHNQDHPIFVFEDDESQQVLGFLEAEVYETIYSDPGLNILGLAVAHSSQGKGIGKALLTFFEAWAMDRQFAFIRLNSGSQRLEAHAFYQRMGYDGWKTQKRFIKMRETFASSQTK